MSQQVRRDGIIIRQQDSMHALPRSSELLELHKHVRDFFGLTLLLEVTEEFQPPDFFSASGAVMLGGIVVVLAALVRPEDVRVAVKLEHADAVEDREQVAVGIEVRASPEGRVAVVGCRQLSSNCQQQRKFEYAKRGFTSKALSS